MNKYIQMLDNKQFLLSITTNIVALIVQVGINFFITPIILQKMGNEAYGYIGLSNNFISYATIITVIFNSVSGRFISIEINKKNIKKANQYFSSTLVANVSIAIFFAFISTIFVIKIEHIFIISIQFINEVKILFLVSYINFIISLVGSIFTVATFVKNRLDKAALRKIISYLFQAVIIILLFHFFQPRIYFLSIATLLSTIYFVVSNIRLTKKIMPEINFAKGFVKKSMLVELISSGAWLSLNNLSNIMMNGLDLLIINYMIDADTMGIVTASKVIPQTITLIITSIGGIYTPKFLKFYSLKQNDKLIKNIEWAVKSMGVIMIVPLSGLLVFGKVFYRLWFPNKSIEEIILIYILSSVTIIPYLLDAITYPLSQMEVVLNRTKIPVLISLFSGATNIVIVVGVLKFTNLGVYAVTGVSSILLTIRYFLFEPIYIAKILRVPKLLFIKIILKISFVFLIITFIFLEIRYHVKINSWSVFLEVSISSGALGYAVSFFLLSRKSHFIKYGYRK